MAWTSLPPAGAHTQLGTEVLRVDSVPRAAAVGGCPQAVSFLVCHNMDLRSPANWGSRFSGAAGTDGREQPLSRPSHHAWLALLAKARCYVWDLCWCWCVRGST